MFFSEHTRTAVSLVGILFDKKQILEPEQVKFAFSIIFGYFSIIFEKDSIQNKQPQLDVVSVFKY